MEDNLRFDPRSQGGQNWSGVGAGLVASCSCGKWTYEVPVQHTNDSGLKLAWMNHAGYIEVVDEEAP